MGPSHHDLVDSWIGDGGVVVAASDRAARAAQMAYHRRRRVTGADAWPAPPIQSWNAFVSAAWERFAQDDRMVLNPAQELELWVGIIGQEQHLAAALEAPRRRLARLAMNAHALLCDYAPRFLASAARSAWDRDAAAFSRWLSAFDRACADGAFLSPSRLAHDLIPMLQRDSSTRPPILLLGFDRLLPIHRAFCDAWGKWQQPMHGPKATEVNYYEARDEDSELHACAIWCMRQLEHKPDARLLVISQDIAGRRGEIERAFLRAAPQGSAPLFEFSLGVPLLHIPLARASFLMLRWLDDALTETELDWLFSSSYGTAGPDESLRLQERMRALRSRGLARPEWTLNDFLRSGHIPPAWQRRFGHAVHLLSSARGRIRTPIEWVSLVPDLLSAIGLTSDRTLASVEFQALQRWEYALDVNASLGFDNRRIPWSEFLSSLERILETTLFAAESADTPIQIAGPEESAGLAADGIWFLGAEEDAWPASGSAQPLLPLLLQREFGMPHASPRLDAELATAVTHRIVTSAAVATFSYAAQREETETRASRLVVAQARTLRTLPANLVASTAANPLTLPFEDTSRVPFLLGKVPGGSAVLTAQSQCALKAFATARLGAKAWEPAEFGLSAQQRGNLLHHVLHAVWSGPPDGFRTLADLLTCDDLRSFVVAHVDRVLQAKLPDEIKHRMPSPYLALEGTRLTRVVVEWLEYEATRHPFTVLQTESKCTVDIAGLTLDLRLDRTDEFNDGSLFVIDYKTGNVNPRDWDLPRPDDVQLPLYAGFACGKPGGLAFAKVRVGDFEFAGRTMNATATLISDPRSRRSLVKLPLTTAQLDGWRRFIEQLARDFVAGRADLDPRDYPKTCDACGLHAICRIHENWIEPEPEEEIEDYPE